MKFALRQIVIFFAVFIPINIILHAQSNDTTSTTKKLNLNHQFWFPSRIIYYPATMLPLTQDHIAIGLSYTAKPPERKAYFDMHNVIPENSLFIDHREGSYYTTRMVEDKMAAVMNRPKPGEVLPVFAAAMIAANLALRHVDIEKKIMIKPEDYLISDMLLQIMLELWKFSPQTENDLYRKSPIAQNRTLKILESQLTELIEKKIVKVNRPAQSAAFYYAAQSIDVVISLLEKTLHDDAIEESLKRQLSQILLKIKGENR